MRAAWMGATASGARIAIGAIALLHAGALLADEATATARTDSTHDAVRTVEGLQVLYDFHAGSGETVEDVSGVGEPLNLRIANPKAVKRSHGALEVKASAQIQSEQPANKLTAAVRQSNEFTIEAWIQPAETNQTGPARIVTLSRNSSDRNFTLGQDGDRYDVRFRTVKTNANGIPSTATGKRSLRTTPTHVVYARDRSGHAKIFLDGRPVVGTSVGGSTENWQPGLQLALGDEFGGGRSWRGTYYMVAIYNRSLRPAEVARHFSAGPDAPATPTDVAKLQRDTKPLGAELFERKIAALLANHCLECHDAPTREGGLDLSRKSFALAGGDSGPAIIPGKAGESLLWQYVESDDMPANRPPLSEQEKQLLRQWLDSGATWSLDAIDPLLYEHDRRAADNWIRRLTVPEYIETVRAAVGVDIAADARALLPPDLRADGFTNTAYNLNVDLQHVEAYARLAEMIVGRMDVPAFVSRFSKSQSLSTDDTMRELVAEMGKWLLRGPLSEREVNVYSGIATTVASAGGDFKEAMELMVEAMLQSPRFIYRVENQNIGGTVWTAGPYELASRLSYIIWGGPPDQQLMAAADEGELYDREKLEAQVQRMLEDPRAIERSKQFASQWLNLGRLENMRPNPERFPQWNEQLARDMRDETLAFFEHIVWEQQRPLADLLNAQFTFATPQLAKHYGIAPQADGTVQYDLASVPDRGGLLTHGSVLTIGGDEASMVSRGLFVLHELLRGMVKDPPPCVDTTPPPTKTGLTQRGIAEARIADSNCGGCHAKFEPLAFGLERFDGIGAFHETDEHGNKLREDGDILIPGTAESIHYERSAQLMDLLAESERVRESLTWKLTQFAVGRPLGAADAPIVQQIHHSAQRDGGTYVSTLTAIVLSDLVQMTRQEKPE